MKNIGIAWLVVIWVGLGQPGFATDHVQKLLVVDSHASYRILSEAMLAELGRLGYEAPTNLQVTYYSLAHFAGRAQRIWDKHQDDGFQVIFVNGTIALRAFKQLVFNDPTVQVVFGSVTDPVGEGVIDDFTHPPKANFTGICHPVKVEDRFQFILDLLPHAKTLGLIYADMPQSRSYNAWVRTMLRTPPFQHLTVLFRQVEFVKSEGGHKRMALLAKQHVLELNDQVDAFVAPNDQMGGQQPFAAMVFRHASKPLIGLNRPDVMEAWGATASMYPSFVWAGKKAGQMIHALLEGQSIQTLIPVWPRTGIALDLHKAEHFGLTISSEMLQRAGNNVRK